MKKSMNRLTFLRKSKIYSQQEMAELLGISQTYYGKLERNPKNLSVDMALRIKAILGVKYIDELIDEAS